MLYFHFYIVWKSDVFLNLIFELSVRVLISLGNTIIVIFFPQIKKIEFDGFLIICN